MQDVRITHPVTSSVRQGNVQNAGGAAKAGEVEKQRKFGVKCDSIGCEFEPLVIEAYGRFGDKAKEIFKRTISATADNKNIDISYLKNYWLKRIAVAIQRGVANKILARVQKLMSGKKSELEEIKDYGSMVLESTTGSSSGVNL